MAVVEPSETTPAITVTLRDVLETDLDVFFAQQRDPEANRMAAFTAEDPADHDAFLAKWRRILADPNIRQQTILAGGRIAGHVMKYELFGEPEITYWLGRDFWGRGIATSALTQFLLLERERPMYGRAAADNLASIRVMQKCGFQIIGRDKSYANARGAEIAEIVLRLAG
jgi:RimJ/RimL family protein N-acetyltransferase